MRITKEKVTIYLLEVGIVLDEKDKEYECYLVPLKNGKAKSLYNKNTCMFVSEEDRNTYIHKYLKNNNDKHGYILSYEQEVDKEEVLDYEEIKKTGDSDYIDIDFQALLNGSLIETIRERE